MFLCLLFATSGVPLRHRKRLLSRQEILNCCSLSFFVIGLLLWQKWSHYLIRGRFLCKMIASFGVSNRRTKWYARSLDAVFLQFHFSLNGLVHFKPLWQSFVNFKTRKSFAAVAILRSNWRMCDNCSIITCFPYWRRNSA